MSVNITCYCKKAMSCKTELVMLLPCGHFFHQACFFKKILENEKNCPLCDSVVGKVMSEDMIKKNKNTQWYIDLLALKYESPESFNYMYYPSALGKLNIIINQMMLCKSNTDAHNLSKTIVQMLNVKIKIINKTINNKICYKNDKINWIGKADMLCKKIIISNHNTFIDPLIIFFLFNCGFISSEFIKKIPFGDIIASKCALLLIKRNDKANGTVEQIKKYLDKSKIIALFPQGGISFGNTLSKFRTGAFYSSDTICPISIKYEPMINDHDIMTLFLKLLSNKKMSVTVTINDFEKGPYSAERIESIREKIALQSDLMLSNVEIRSLSD